MNHQSIVDRIEAMRLEAIQVHNDCCKSQAAEKKQLRAQCGQLGHVFVRDQFASGFFLRNCAVCGVTEPRSERGAV